MKPAPPVISTGARRRRRAHATSPRSSSSRRASATRSLRLLARDPLGELGEPGGEVLARRVAEHASRAFARSAMLWRMSPARAWPVISGSRSGRPIAAACRRATSSTVRSSPEPMLKTSPSAPRVVEGEQEGAGDVADVDEVAPLLAVLEDHRRLAVGDPRGEDREHAGVGVRERLAGAVDVPEPERRALHAVLARSGSGVIRSCTYLPIA